MESKQKMKEFSVDNEQEQLYALQFAIQMDIGNLFIPGKLITRPYNRVVYCRSNCGAVFTVGENNFRLQRGDMLLIRSNVPHGVVSYGKEEEVYNGFMVSATSDYLRDVLGYFLREASVKKDCILVHTRGTIWENVDRLFAMALEEVSLKAPGWETAFLGISRILMVRIARIAASDPNFNVQLERTDLLTGILSYVENNLSERITLEDVASRFFVSTSTVTHLFNKKMNISFYQYVLRYRLWKAKNLILEGLPMEKVAAQVGFNDYSAFYRAFKQEFGISPRQYYKQSLEGGKE